MMAHLHDHHRWMLQVESGISAKTIAERGYRSVDDPAELIRLGFAPSQARPGLLIPLYSTAGVQIGWMLRPNDPRLDGHDKILKYEVPAGSSPMIDCPPAMAVKLRDASIPLYITEGSKKADAAADRGLLCVSLGGVYGFLQHKLVIADLDDINLFGRTVILAFDSDVMTKPEVADARSRLGKACQRRGAKVFVVTLPPGPNGEKVGLDDFFAAGGTVADLDALTTPWQYEVVEPPEVVQLKAERDQLIRDNAVLLRTMANPHVKPAEKTGLAALLIVAANKPGAAPGKMVRLSADEIANDFRKEPEKKGEHVAPFNADGTRPRMARAQVKATLKAAMERGLLSVKPQPARVERKDGSSYERTEWEFTLPESVADYMKPAALFEPPEPQPRKPRRIDSCIHCGEVHPIERIDVCTGCGQIRHREIIEPSAEERTPDNLSGVADGGMSFHTDPIELSSPAPTLGKPDNLSGVPQEPEWLVNAPDPEEERPITSSASAARLEAARADLLRHRAAAEAHPLLAAADEATDPSQFRRANADLFSTLESFAREQGRSPDPKPNAPPGRGSPHWDTEPHAGAQP